MMLCKNFVIIDGHAFLDCPFLGTMTIVLTILFTLFVLIVLILYLYRVGFSHPAQIVSFILSCFLVVSDLLLFAGLAFQYYCFCTFFQYLTFFTSIWSFIFVVAFFVV